MKRKGTHKKIMNKKILMKPTGNTGVQWWHGFLRTLVYLRLHTANTCAKGLGKRNPEDVAIFKFALCINDITITVFSNFWTVIFSFKC